MARNPWNAEFPKTRLQKGSLRVVFWNPVWSLAVGLWDSDRRLLNRWNGDPGPSKGNPGSRAYPTWFVLPEELHNAILDDLKTANCALAKAWLAGTGSLVGLTDPVPAGWGDH